MKQRQLGCTVGLLNYLLFLCCQSYANNAAIFLKTQKDARIASEKLQQQFKSISQDYNLKFDIESTTLLRPKVNEVIKALFQIQGFVDNRSSSCKYLFVDECAFAEAGRMERLLAGILPTLTTFKDSGIYYVSTPNGKEGNWWWNFLSRNNDKGTQIDEIARQVCEGKLFTKRKGFYHFVDKNNTIKIFMSYQLLPAFAHMSFDEYIEHRMQEYSLDRDTALQEYGLTFNSSTLTVFEEADVFSCKSQEKLWEDEPDIDPEVRYLASIDPNFGGDDFIVCYVFKIKGRKKWIAHRFRANKQPTDRSILTVSGILTTFKPFKVAIEKNSGGEVYCSRFKNAGWDVIEHNTSAQSKSKVISQLILSLQERNIEYSFDDPLVEELLQFKRLGQTQTGLFRYGAPPGLHDDCVMAAAIGNYYCEEWINNPAAYKPKHQQQTSDKEVFEKLKKSNKRRMF